MSVTEFSEVLPPFFPPPTFSSVRVGGVMVVVGGCGGTVSGTQGGRSKRRTHRRNKCKHTRARDVTRDNLAKNSL